MAEPKTQKTNVDPKDFINTLANEQMKQDSLILIKLFEDITGEKAAMWGPAIIGFGEEMLNYSSGKSLPWPKAAFSPRKAYLTLYVLVGGEEKYEDLLKKLGKYTTAKICLYIKKLSDVDMEVLREIIKRSLKTN